MPRRPRIPNQQKTNKFIAAIIEGKPVQEASKAAGYAETTGYQVLENPKVMAKIEEGLSDAAVAAGVSRAWVISKLKEVAERCLQARPVLDKLGHETGLFVFDASGANRSLELIGKHLRVFGDDATPAAQLGASVMRILAQEAQQGRFAKSIDADVVPTRAGPISEPEEKQCLASTRLDTIPPKDHTVTTPVPIENDAPTL
jgi:phage terminase small subunit